MPKGGLEPPRVTSHAPQTCASASSATSARLAVILAVIIARIEIIKSSNAFVRGNTVRLSLALQVYDPKVEC